MGAYKQVAFFLNVYQSMYIHFFIKYIYDDKHLKPISGLLEKFRLSVSAQKPFRYQIGEREFSLHDIKHGLFRNDRPKPGSFLPTMSFLRMKSFQPAVVIPESF